MISVQPRWASSRASASPRPREAPVIKAVWFVAIVGSFRMRSFDHPVMFILYRHTIAKRQAPPLRPTGLSFTCTNGQGVNDLFPPRHNRLTRAARPS